MQFIAPHASYMWINFNLLNKISLVAASLKIERKMRNIEKLGATIGGLGVLEFHLKIIKIKVPIHLCS